MTGLADVVKSLKSDDPNKPRERLALGAHGEVLSLSTNGKYCIMKLDDLVKQ